jgi:hypothetical protein
MDLEDLNTAEDKLPSSYSDAWSKYRRNRSIALSLFLGWVPIMGCFTLLAGHHTIAIAAETAVAIAWIAFLFYFSLRWAFWPCPRCGKLFRGKSRTLPRQCQHCSLER